MFCCVLEFCGEFWLVWVLSQDFGVLKMLTVGGRMWIRLVVFVSMNHGFYASFTPTGSYLLACGSSQNITLIICLIFWSSRVKKLD